MFDDAGPHPVVEHHPPVLQPILEVHVDRGGAEPRRQLGQRQVVRGHQTDRVKPDQRPHHAFGADPAIVRIRAVKNLVEQKQQRHRTTRRLHDRPDAKDLREEAGVAGLQRVLDVKRGAEDQRRQAKPPCRDRRA